MAFGLFSASGFHVARAVEGTLEAYYQLMTRKIETKNGWHEYIEELRRVEGQPKPSERVLTELHQIKDESRNPLMHPRVILTETEARMLFDNGEAVIIAMATEIATAKGGGRSEAA